MKRGRGPLYDAIVETDTVTIDEKVTICKRVIRDLSTQYVREAGNEFFWVRLFPKDICELILSYVTIKTQSKNKHNMLDINQILNLGLVCKMWWRGPPEDAWYREANSLANIRRPFCILSYMRQRFVQHLEVPIKNTLLSAIKEEQQRIVHFEGFAGGQWAYVKDDKQHGSYYIPVEGYPVIWFRPLMSGVVLDISVIDNCNFIHNVRSIPRGPKGKIGQSCRVGLTFLTSYFKKQHYHIPKTVVFQFHLKKDDYYSMWGRRRAEDNSIPIRQQIEIRIMVPKKHNAYNIRKTIKAGTNKLHKMVD